MATQKKNGSSGAQARKGESIWQQRSQSIALIILLVFISISLVSYSPSDQSFIFDSMPAHGTKNWCGWLGSYCASLLLYFFGCLAWLIPLLLLYCARIIMFDLNWKRELDRVIGLGALLLVLTGTARYYDCELYHAIRPGGLVGRIVLSFINHSLSAEQCELFLFISVWALLVIIARFSCISYLYPFIELLKKIPFAPFIEKIQRVFHKIIRRDQSPETSHTAPLEFHPLLQQPHEPQVKQTHTMEIEIIPAVEEEAETELRASPAGPYRLPPLTLFPSYKEQSTDETSVSNDGKQRAQVLEHKLERFGIKGKVVSITQGPVVTLFEYQPSIDTKISTILAREDDLALALQALSLRIIAPIPGRSVIGFEVAHNKRKAVLFSQALKSTSFSSFNGTLPLILGKDTLGGDVVIDLASMPHLLVAGSTGSGKSVGLHTMIMSLLCSKTPDEIKLILIDPKRLEFAAYADCAHLIFPIVTDPRRAVAVLKWAVETMEDRYAHMALAGVRNCTEYNNRLQPGDEKYFPLIVIVIDELADLMMTAGKDVEQCIARLAQMARAAGIHLIGATQRPSVDVITGLIKVNFPSRIAYKVTSKVDSRTILDMMGAEKLLGKGDMLYLDVKGAIHRVHGALVTDTEIQSVVTHIKGQRAVEYKELTTVRSEEPDGESDELFQDVIQYIKNKDEISISLIQRVFRIGYNRSARIIDQLESYGYILPSDGSKMRKVAKDQ